MRNCFDHISLLFAWLVLGSLAYLCIGCGGSAEVDRTFRIAYVMAPGGTSDLGANKIKELIEANKELDISVKVYPNAVLGKDRELMEGLKLNSIDLVIGGPSVIGMYAPEYQLLEAPFLFRDYSHLKKVLNGKIGERLEAEMADRFGYHYLGYFLRGPRYLTTTNRVISKPTDLAGLKLRVPELSIYIKAWEAFGANPTPLAFSDMFMALRQGVVEGQENPLEVIYTNNFQEVQEYIMETKHLLSFYVLAVGDRFYEKYTEGERFAIRQAIDEAVIFHDAKLEEYENDYRKKLIAAGVKFEAVDRASFEQIAKEKLPEIFKGEWKEGLFEEIVNTK